MGVSSVWCRRDVYKRQGLTMAVLVDRIGIKLGVSISTLAIQILAGGFFFCIATIAYLRISNDEMWRLGVDSIKKRKKSSWK